jgi:hypothetical protein
MKSLAETAVSGQRPFGLLFGCGLSTARTGKSYTLIYCHKKIKLNQ